MALLRVALVGRGDAIEVKAESAEFGGIIGAGEAEMEFFRFLLTPPPGKDESEGVGVEIDTMGIGTADPEAPLTVAIGTLVAPVDATETGGLPWLESWPSLLFRREISKFSFSNASSKCFFSLSVCRRSFCRSSSVVGLVDDGGIVGKSRSVSITPCQTWCIA